MFTRRKPLRPNPPARKISWFRGQSAMKRKIAAIMAADIAGYSKLVSDDEEETLRRLAAYRSVFDDFIAKASGRVFNTAGDAVLAEFASAVEAVRCAIDIQESLRTRNMAYPASRQMNFRIGITIGDVVEREGDLLGEGVNIAARLEGLAEPGGICVSRTVYEQVANKLSVRFADIGEQLVKNIPTPVHAYAVAVTPIGGPLSDHREKAFSRWLAPVAIISVIFVGGAGFAYFTLSRAPAPAPQQATTPPATTNQQSAVRTQPQKPDVATAPPSTTPVPSVTAPRQTITPPTSTKQQPAAGSQPQQQAVVVPPPAVARLNEAKIRALAEQLNLPLPRHIQIVEPSSSVPKIITGYLGAWGSDRRWGGRGRHMMLLVTAVDETGAATGILSFGPPTPYTFNQNPANYWPFSGKIAENQLHFRSPNGQLAYHFKILPDGIMEGLLEAPNNRHPSIAIERIN
jgi:class 3 adenylate cyclase